MSPRESIAHYCIVCKLGEGGMGVVYRATDTKLNRDVAIKVLPPALAGDAQYMARFEREAQTLAALNHPNIATVYGVEQGALIMELVDGPTLEDRIGQGPVPVEEAIPIARQIVDGLEAAHERGIVHRDLKPANIKLTAEGKVKLLDFGLAKSASEFAAAAPGVSPTMSPTLSMAMTQAGMILGTAAYMSPEQARGKPVDKRADIWAFGVVLYEMLTGKHLFGGGETITDTLASVVKDTPDLNALPADTPAQVRRLLARCLRKDVKARLRDIGEARMVLDEPPEPAPTAATPAAAAPLHRVWLPWTVAAVAAVVAAGTIWHATRPAPLAPLLRLNVDLGEATRLSFGRGSTVFAISPDGTRLAMSVESGRNNQRILGTRLLSQEPVTLLSGTEGAASPFFSPDGEWIGFWAEGKLKKVAVTGGAPLTLCSLGSLRGASWFDDGTIVVADGTSSRGLLRVPSAGGEPVDLTKLGQGERTHRHPQVLPEYQLVLFTAAGDAVSYDNAQIVALSLQTGARTTLVRGGHSATYLSTGHLLYQHEGTLYAARFDPRHVALTSLPAPVLEGVPHSTGGGALMTVSRNGTLVYLQGEDVNNVSGTIVFLDAAGKQQEIHSVPGNYGNPRLSPDNRRLAFTVATGKGVDIWVKDLERGATSRLTFTPGSNTHPIWTPDGKAIVYRSASNMYWIPSDGSGQAQTLTDTGASPRSISPDGKYVAYSIGKSSLDIFTAPMEGAPGHPRLGKPEPFVATPALEVEPRFSPDGRWIAYVSQESGTSELYVRPFPGPGGRWQISTGGGNYSVWSPKTQELLYESPQGIMAVPYSVSGGAFSAGKPRLWTPMHPSGGGGAYNWDIAADGKRLVIVKNGADSPIQESKRELTFLLNFGDELKRKTR